VIPSGVWFSNIVGVQEEVYQFALMNVIDSMSTYTTSKAMSIATQNYHRATLRSFHPRLQNTSISRLRPEDLLEERDRQLRRGTSQTTVSKRIRTLITWVRLEASKATEVDPSLFSLRLPRGKAKQRDLDPDLAGAVWESYRQKPHWALAVWLCQYHSGGARITDALCLPALKPGQTRLMWTSSKTQFEHDVALGQELLLLTHRHGNKAQFIEVPCWDEERAQKHHPDHRKLIQSATTRVNKELKDRGLNCTSHDARRCAAYGLLSKGIDVDTVRRTCGWHKSEMVLKYSSHVSNNKVDYAVGLLGSSI